MRLHGQLWIRHTSPVSFADILAVPVAVSHLLALPVSVSDFLAIPVAFSDVFAESVAVTASVPDSALDRTTTKAR